MSQFIQRSSSSVSQGSNSSARRNSNTYAQSKLNLIQLQKKKPKNNQIQLSPVRDSSLTKGKRQQQRKYQQRQQLQPFLPSAMNRQQQPNTNSCFQASLPFTKISPSLFVFVLIALLNVLAQSGVIIIAIVNRLTGSDPNSNKVVTVCSQRVNYRISFFESTIQTMVFVESILNICVLIAILVISGIMYWNLRPRFASIDIDSESEEQESQIPLPDNINPNDQTNILNKQQKKQKTLLASKAAGKKKSKRPQIHDDLSLSEQHFFKYKKLIILFILQSVSGLFVVEIFAEYASFMVDYIQCSSAIGDQSQFNLKNEYIISSLIAIIVVFFTIVEFAILGKWVYNMNEVLKEFDLEGSEEKDSDQQQENFTRRERNNRYQYRQQYQQQTTMGFQQQYTFSKINNNYQKKNMGAHQSQQQQQGSANSQRRNTQQLSNLNGQNSPSARAGRGTQWQRNGGKGVNQMILQEDNQDGDDPIHENQVIFQQNQQQSNDPYLRNVPKGVEISMQKRKQFKHEYLGFQSATMNQKVSVSGDSKRKSSAAEEILDEPGNEFLSPKNGSHKINLFSVNRNSLESAQQSDNEDPNCSQNQKTSQSSQLKINFQSKKSKKSKKTSQNDLGPAMSIFLLQKNESQNKNNNGNRNINGDKKKVKKKSSNMKVLSKENPIFQYIYQDEQFFEQLNLAKQFQLKCIRKPNQGNVQIFGANGEKISLTNKDQKPDQDKPVLHIDKRGRKGNYDLNEAQQINENNINSMFNQLSNEQYESPGLSIGCAQGKMQNNGKMSVNPIDSNKNLKAEIKKQLKQFEIHGGNGVGAKKGKREGALLDFIRSKGAE